METATTETQDALTTVATILLPTNQLTYPDARKLLKIKIKSLAAEAKIIRLEEKRTFGSMREELYLHRIGIVRRAAREAQLAYGFIRGRAWSKIEPKSRGGDHAPDWKNIERLINKYGIRQLPYLKDRGFQETSQQFAARQADQTLRFKAWIEGKKD